MNGSMFSAVRKYVTNGFLPRMVVVNLSLPISFDTEF